MLPELGSLQTRDHGMQAKCWCDDRKRIAQEVSNCSCLFFVCPPPSMELCDLHTIEYSGSTKSNVTAQTNLNQSGFYQLVIKFECARTVLRHSPTFM